MRYTTTLVEDLTKSRYLRYHLTVLAGTEVIYQAHFTVREEAEERARAEIRFHDARTSQASYDQAGVEIAQMVADQPASVRWS